jgi:hypothetical protein
VLVAALDLFKASPGPVLKDFSHEGTNHTALKRSGTRGLGLPGIVYGTRQSNERQ